MAKYILLVNWTDQGVRRLRTRPKRLDAARKLAETAGARMGDFYMTMGGYDMVAHLEAPGRRHGRQVRAVRWRAAAMCGPRR